MEPISPLARTGRTDPKSLPLFQPNQWHPLWLSARNAKALDEASQRLAQHLRRNPQLRPLDVSYTLLAGREHFSHRRVLSCRDLASATAQLEQEGESAHQPARMNGLLMIFPDSPNPYTGAGLGMYSQYAVFRNHLDHCAGLLEEHLPLDLRQLLFSDDRSTRKLLKQRAVGRPLALVLQTGLYLTWKAMGYQGSELVGVGLGQWAGACAAEIFDLECMLHLAVLLGEVEDGTRHRSLLVDALAAAAPRLGHRPLVSGSKGTLVTEDELADPQIWIDAIERTSHDTTPLLNKPGCLPLILGSASSLTQLPGSPLTAQAAMREADDQRDDAAFSCDTAGALYLKGLCPSWPEFFAGSPWKRVPLPSYAFQHQRYWFTPGPEPEIRLAEPTATTANPSAKDLLNLLNGLDEQALDQLLVELAQTQTPTAASAVKPPPEPAKPQAKTAKQPVKASTAPKPVQAKAPVAPKPQVAESAHTRPELDTAYVAPRDELEQRLAQICGSMLQIDRVGINDNIIHLGADSIFTMQLSRSIEAKFGVTITPHHLFAEPNIASLAKTIREERK